jgi:hypothetical protein
MVNALGSEATLDSENGAYTLTASCPGFRPYVREVVYGRDMSPSKPLDLGVVILLPEP